MLFIDLKLEKNPEPPKKLTKINYNKLLSLSSNLNWDTVYNANDINNAVNNFVDLIENVIKKSRYQIKISHDSIARKHWVTPGLIKSCKIKNSLYKLLKKTPDNESIKLKYVNYKSKLKYLLNVTKNNYHNNLLNKVSNNTKKL